MNDETRVRPGGRRRKPSAATERANRFVSDHLAAAERLGEALADLVTDPSEFVAALKTGFERLVDPVYRSAQDWVVPGAPPAIGVRTPLIRAVERPIIAALRPASPAVAIYLADALSRPDVFELRIVALAALRRSLPADPERSWQLMRRLAGLASDWASVDALADLYARGLLLEPFRWAEIEQLVYSRQRWERRLVGSTLAELPSRLPRARRSVLRDRPGLTIIESLLGDPEPDVQKALSWALRSWRGIDPQGVAALLRAETKLALATDDGARAWVIRDALTGVGADPSLAAELTPRLAGLRRRAGAPDTSRAHALAAGFGVEARPEATTRDEPPLEVGPSRTPDRRSVAPRPAQRSLPA